MSTAKTRNVSLDVLRCLLMFGVVLQHAFAVCKFGGIIPYAAYALLDSFTHPSVDGFTAISGWFGIRCTLKKLFRLFCLILFCGTVHFGLYQLGVLCCANAYKSSFGLDFAPMSWGYECYRYWYLGAYVKLMLLTLLLNPIFSYLSKWPRWSLWLVAGAFVGANYLSLLWMPWESHSPRTVIFVYVVVRFFVLLGILDWVRCRFAKYLFGSAAGILFAVAALDGMHRWGLTPGMYRSPVVIMAGLTAVAYFASIQISEKGVSARLASLLAPSMISVYMLHWNIADTFLKPVPQYVLGKCPWLNVSVVFVVVAACIFLLCIAIDLMRRYMVSKIYLFIDQHNIRLPAWMK